MPSFYMFYKKIIDILNTKTKEVILFHSGTGKDSIALCDMLSKRFEKVLCVFMYIVPGLEYEEKRIEWAKKTYSNIEFYKTPHYALNSFIKHGYLGIKKDVTVEKMLISKIDERVKLKFGIDWSVYGFKKIDGVTRRVMLNGYENGMFEKTKKAYPLMDLTNNEVMQYIKDNDLINPFNYGTLKPSSGCDISTPEFLAYIRKNHPNDLRKIYDQFPLCEAILFKYDNYGKN